MTPETVVAPLPDFFSPVFVKELRQGLRAHRFVLPFVAAQIFAVLAVGTEFGIAAIVDAAITGGGASSDLLGRVVMWVLWGVIGDRAGHKVVLTSAAFALALAALNTLLAPTQGWLVLSFVLLGMYSSGDAVSGLNIILEFAAPEDRPTYIGLTNTLLAPTIVLAPILGGWIATVAGFPVLLVTAATIAATGALLLAFWVDEPRQKPLPGD